MILLSYLFRAVVVGSLCFLAARLIAGALASKSDGRESERESIPEPFDGGEYGYSSRLHDPLYRRKSAARW
jgi:hypothetical protein